MNLRWEPGIMAQEGSSPVGGGGEGGNEQLPPAERKIADDTRHWGGWGVRSSTWAEHGLGQTHARSIGNTAPPTLKPRPVPAQQIPGFSRPQFPQQQPQGQRPAVLSSGWHSATHS